MSLNKIVLEALAKNPIGLKESLSEILSEKIAIALERKMEESTQLDEISGSTLGSYMVKANKDMKKNRDAASDVMTNFMRRGGTPTKKDIDDAQSEYMKYDKKANNRNRGLSNAESKLKGSSFVKIHATEDLDESIKFTKTDGKDHDIHHNGKWVGTIDADRMLGGGFSVKIGGSSLKHEVASETTLSKAKEAAKYHLSQTKG